jgi:hypothetical protein
MSKSYSAYSPYSGRFVARTDDSRGVWIRPSHIIEGGSKIKEIGTIDWSICEYCNTPNDIHKDGGRCVSCGAPLSVTMYVKS